MSTITPTAEKISEYISAMNLAEDAEDYAGKLKFQMELVSGTNYNMVWSERHSDRFPPADD